MMRNLKLNIDTNGQVVFIVGVGDNAMMEEEIEVEDRIQSYLYSLIFSFYKLL